MNPIGQDFVSGESRTFHFKIGKMLASSLTGFIAGVIVASVVWTVGVWYINQLQKISPPSSAKISSTSIPPLR